MIYECVGVLPMNDNYNNVLERLREERMRLRLSQSQMGQYLHMSQSHYSKVELGNRRMTFMEMDDLCKTGIDIHYVFTNEKGRDAIGKVLEKCEYVELLCCTNIIYSISVFSCIGQQNQQWHCIFEKIKFLQYIEEGYNLGKTILYSLRRGLGYQQQKMAEELGIDVKKLREMENGRCLPDSEILFRVYELFQIPPSFFLKDCKGIAHFISSVVDMIHVEDRHRVKEMLSILMATKK